MKPTVITTLLFCASLHLGCNRADGNAPPPTPAGEAWLTPEQVQKKFKTEIVADHEVGGMIPASGKITFDDLRVSPVFSPVTGRITKILAQPGQRLKKGAALAIIQSPDVGTAFSDLAKAQADLIAAEHDFKRKKDLYEAHAGSQSDFEQAEDNYGKAKAEMERAQKKARLLRSGAVDQVTQEYTLLAPIDGEVITRAANPGMEVQGTYSGGTPTPGGQLFTVGEIDHVWIFADVYEMDISRVQKGQRVTVRVVAYPNKIYEGVVDYVSGALDATTRTAKVRCSIPNPERELKPEMYATVSVYTAGHLSLAVPRPAIFRIGEQLAVFVEKRDEHGKPVHGPKNEIIFVRRDVAIDEEEDGDYVPIKNGLERGERIVTAGGIELLGMI
jgi:cobalt-zinc-cadmium efflux system membrane fusion protein